jgi:hypothetical protein
MKVRNCIKIVCLALTINPFLVGCEAGETKIDGPVPVDPCATECDLPEQCWSYWGGQTRCVENGDRTKWCATNKGVRQDINECVVSCTTLEQPHPLTGRRDTCGPGFLCNTQDFVCVPAPVPVIACGDGKCERPKENGISCRKDCDPNEVLKDFAIDICYDGLNPVGLRGQISASTKVNEGSVWLTPFGQDLPINNQGCFSFKSSGLVCEGFRVDITTGPAADKLWKAENLKPSRYTVNGVTGEAFHWGGQGWEFGPYANSDTCLEALGLL